MAIVAITATPTGSTRIEAPLWCLACAAFGQRAAVDLLLNVALYVPLGLGLRLMGLSWRAAVSIAFGVTLTIELLQMRIIAGRFASVGDVFANTLGSWAGAVVAPRWRAFLLPDARLARHLTALGAVAWLALLVGTVAGLQPTAPGGEYRARFGRDRRHDDSFAGRVLSASLNGRPLPGGPLAESETLRRHLRDGGALVEVVVFTTGEPRDRTPILTLGAKGQRILVLAQDGHDVVLERRTRAVDVRFRSPSVRLRDVLAAPPGGDTVRLTAAVLPGGLEVSADRGGTRTTEVLPYGPHLGWTFFFRYDAYGRWAPVLTAGWLVAPLFLLGYWAGRTGGAPRRGPLLGLWGLMGAALLLVPLAGGFPPPAWWQWLVGAIAVTAGWRLACNNAAPFLPRGRRNWALLFRRRAT